MSVFSESGFYWRYVLQEDKHSMIVLNYQYERLPTVREAELFNTMENEHPYTILVVDLSDQCKIVDAIIMIIKFHPSPHGELYGITNQTYMV
ncbi:hypothetical protein G9A89_018126 [Geosiphon pyriformis]|nr:hypothetical protein G9A89_018126 [Geosiphon pyriformis]